MATHAVSSIGLGHRIAKLNLADAPVRLTNMFILSVARPAKPAKPVG